MQGFRDNIYNVNFEVGFFESIIEHLKKCSSEMKADCLKTGNWLYNHEDKITNRLVENYLNKNPSVIRFILQSPENFMSGEDTYEGRLDLKAVSLNWFNNITDYYTIECKRIDGESHLNREYIINGVARFVGNSTLYPSHNRRNIMFGYIVRAVDIPQNTIKIEELQNKHLDKVAASKFVLEDNMDSEYFVYSSQYKSEESYVELRHLFYDFADVMAK
jgi:hypothetical protein